jgi:hypothetical protein
MQQWLLKIVGHSHHFIHLLKLLSGQLETRFKPMSR